MGEFTASCGQTRAVKPLNATIKRAKNGFIVSFYAADNGSINEMVANTLAEALELTRKILE